jgi:predicted dehydrogenase
MNRRNFIKQSALAGLAVNSYPFIIRKPIAKYKTALIGSGWWGMNILREAIRSGEIQVVALCDVDENQIKKAAAEVNTLCSDSPKHYKDFRECLKKEKPDIVINATPDHWHALIAIEAMKSGAHIFLEKPISHTVKEGTMIQKTARDTQRICIVDFHRRYSPHNVSAMDFLKSGKVGTVKDVRAFVNYGFWGAGKPNEKEAIPEGLDWDFYCGPSEIVPYSKNIHPRGWRQYSQFGNGQLADWGPHWFDQILWWTEEKAPKKIFSVITDPTRGTSQSTPEAQTVVYEFEDFVCTWEHSILNGRSQYGGENVGVFFHGTEGTLHTGWQSGWTFYPADKKKEIIKQAAQLDEPDQQNIKLVWQDFMNSIKTGKLPFADIEKGRQATNMALLGMLSARLGRSIEWDEKNDKILNDKQANKMLSRKYRGNWIYPT